MSEPTTSDELSLINGSEFLEELQHLDQAIGTPHRPEASRPLFNDNYASLDRGLPMWAAAPPVEAVPAQEPPPARVDAEPPGISMKLAAIVIAASLTAGAATAAYVFQDTLTRITALRSASR